MSWIVQFLWMAFMLAGVVLALYIGFWLLLAFFTVAVLAVIWVHLREFLLAKGILNPTPGVPMGDVVDVSATAEKPLIEGDFTRVEDKNSSN